MKSGIYKILNKLNGKFYIGSAVNLRLRWNTHSSNLNTNKHKNRYLQAAWNKDSNWNFEFIVIEYCEKDKLIEREQFWIDQTKCHNREIGYNFRLIANSQFGLKLPHSKETIDKIVAANKGKKRSEEAKKNNSEAQKGKKLSDEHREKLRVAGTGRIFPEDVKKKISAAHRANSSWPHELGYNCLCNECAERKNKPRRLARMKTEFILVNNTNV